MAGLYIRENSSCVRIPVEILVVAPGSLVEQWREELFEKFGLQFSVFSSALQAALLPATHSRFGPFDSSIGPDGTERRNPGKLLATSWDLGDLR